MEKKTNNAAPGVEVEGLSGVQTLIVAAAAGLSVANIYYAQPLLDLMAHDLGIPAATVGLIVMVTQVGYCLGLIFIVPICDLIDRRKLIIAQGLLLGIALVTVGTAGTSAMLLTGMGAVGLSAVLVQTLVAQAAALATPAQRGRVVGMVTSGIVTGILAARSFSGAIADIGGWRAVYLISASIALVMVIVLMSMLPRQYAKQNMETYTHALLSIPTMFLRERSLLYRGVLALLIFAAFSTFWTALVLPLSAPPFSYSHTRIGLFGLVGLAGAIAATCAGRLADRGHGRWTTGFSLAILLSSWGLIALLPVSMMLLLVGVVLMDLAVQAVHVTNLSAIVAFNPQKSGRLIGGYMVFYSVGSAVGAIAATTIYSRFGWMGISLVGAAFSAIALALWIKSEISERTN
ncbi:MFS transporter [Agrobacterium rosae]|uniref:MFS transporter n=1 Tax=Agrobacterium rosae TaxID=1972867 RepID=A0AAE5VLX2_9HYPH|nr:MFS transporter [Agrobacterium rosae]KAA3506543.1 MFS transporter [Agrobacterium rosae]KAA3516590.1 MFS transporter [Agrobacterium rosae]MCM2436283.1 MFS transporter [Agrobacterium rosae]MDX8332958.1 MFS transporter [Agrobacterium rosae]MQB50401.1 MFS transporter [Agrobacterium rosae]